MLCRKNLSENEALERMKMGCLFMFLQLVVPASTELSRILYPPEPGITNWTYARLIVLVVSLAISIFSTWLLVQMWRACKAIGLRF